jgi:2-oxoglutarate ferredoxin oxidoreductase subunit alpha
MGSVTATALEAQAAMAAAGREVAVLSLRLLAPLPTKQLATLLSSATRLLVVEHNHGAQLWHYLRSLLPQLVFESLALPGPAAIQPRDIDTALEAANAT